MLSPQVPPYSQFPTHYTSPHLTDISQGNCVATEAQEKQGEKEEKGRRGEQWECAEERLSGDWVGRKGSKEEKKTDAWRRERNGEKRHNKAGEQGLRREGII